MDTESAGAIREAFQFDVHRNFEGLSRWVPSPLTAAVWEDGREAVFAVSHGAGELIRFTVACDTLTHHDRRSRRYCDGVTPTCFWNSRAK